MDLFDRFRVVLGCSWFSAGLVLMCLGDQEAQGIAAFVGAVFGMVWMSED